MANFKLRCFCYGIVVSSIIWVIIVYTFLTEVGSQKKLPALSDSYFPNKEARKEKKVHFVHKWHRKDWENNDDTNDIISNKDRKKMSQDHYFNKMNEKRNKKQSKLVTASGVEQIVKDEDDFAKLGIVRNEDEKMIRDNGYRQHAFNELVSSRIGLHRNATDTRHPL